ncbi:HAMP domain-containing protein [candidate division KSB1 bacterium]|nr:HAMP domain-containing protein [candidate division KSB1 bacterium]
MKINGFKAPLKSKIVRKLFLFTFSALSIAVLIMAIPLYRNVSPIHFYPLLAAFFLLALVLAFAVSFLLSRALTNPISEFTKSATEIARGNFDHKIRISSDDELGRLARLFNYMTTELRRLDNMNLAQIIAERNKTQTILRNIADGVIVTDPRSRILLLNTYAERWFNISEKEISEHPLSELIREPKLLQLIAEATSRRKSLLPSVEITTKAKDEWKPRILQARAARVQQENGELIGIVTVLRDVTQQKEIDRMKTELVSMVAHELRSPLTSISGFSELLLDEDISRENSVEYASIILKEASRLSELINKFLDISRIESGRIQPKKVEHDITETIYMVVGNNSYIAVKKNIKVEVQAPPELSKVYADVGMMEQVFLNLFSNAVKYSPDNTRIDILIQELPEAVVVRVRDQGYGIPPEALEKIFDKFYRVSDNEKVREIQGTGLGLNLVKQIVEMHNGRIEVESEMNRGSVFSVFLPPASGQAEASLSEKDTEEMIR